MSNAVTDRQREIIFGFFTNNSRTFYAKNADDVDQCQMFVDNFFMHPGVPNEKGMQFNLTRKGIRWFRGVFKNWGLL